MNVDGTSLPSSIGITARREDPERSPPRPRRHSLPARLTPVTQRWDKSKFAIGDTVYRRDTKECVKLIWSERKRGKLIWTVRSESSNQLSYCESNQLQKLDSGFKRPMTPLP